MTKKLDIIHHNHYLELLGLYCSLFLNYLIEIILFFNEEKFGMISFVDKTVFTLRECIQTCIHREDNNIQEYLVN